MPFKFDETKQYGQYAQILLDINCRVDRSAIYHIVGFYEMNVDVEALAKRWLQCDINEYIPEQYHKCVQWIIHGPNNSGDPLDRYSGTVGWKYTPSKRKQLPEKAQ